MQTRREMRSQQTWRCARAVPWAPRTHAGCCLGPRAWPAWSSCFAERQNHTLSWPACRTTRTPACRGRPGTAKAARRHTQSCCRTGSRPALRRSAGLASLRLSGHGRCGPQRSLSCETEQVVYASQGGPGHTVPYLARRVKVHQAKLALLLMRAPAVHVTHRPLLAPPQSPIR